MPPALGRGAAQQRAHHHQRRRARAASSRLQAAPRRAWHAAGGAACSAAAHGLRGPASAAQPSAADAAPCCCRTVTSVASPDDLQLVLTANDLVAEVFYQPADNPLHDAISFNSYRLRSAAMSFRLHMQPSRSHATIVALAGGSAAQQQPAGAQHAARDQPPDWRRRQPLHDAERAVGVVNVSLMEASPSIAAAAGMCPGTPFAMITNMGVLPHMRRRGIAHALMRAAVRAALVELDCAPSFALLLAYKHYEAAMRLYESWGFSHTPWMDPLWQADAEKGRLGRQRRILMMKPLSAAAARAAAGCV